jgi:hypothetical protein
MVSPEVWQTDHPDYPRRQCQRERWQSLDGPWDFHIDHTGRESLPRHVESWESVIEVPFAPECRRSGIGDTGFHSTVWYRREFHVRPAAGNRVMLHVGAVDFEAKVWVNGLFVARHAGGYTPFTVDITDELVEDGPQVVTVFVRDDAQDLTQPRGKQDWRLEPHSIWYPRTTGIWQTVWLEEVPPLRIERLSWTPHLERWEIGFDAFIEGRDSLPVDVRVRLCVGDTVLSDDRYGVIESEVHRTIGLSDPGVDDYRNDLLWSPESPALIDAEVTVIVGGTVVDRVRSYTALRGVDLHRGRFLLNNRPYYLRLLLDQGYWPESLMTPPSEEAIIRDIELIKAAGFNGVRKHQKIEDPRFLYWADRLGLLVWEEMPSAYRFTHESAKRIAKEWTEVIDRDANHPCIVVWVPFNESWGVPNLPGNEAHRSCVQALYHLTRTLDPSRPVIGNDGWESSATDIIGIHDYDDDPDRLRARYRAVDVGDGTSPDLTASDWAGGRVTTLEGHPHVGQPIMLTEFGGIALHDDRTPTGNADAVWGYSAEATARDLEARYGHLLAAVSDVEAFSGFCYTQFTDTFQEANGLFYADRTPKIDIDRLRIATARTREIPHERPAGGD